jgi:hypothetical protein
MYDFIPMNAHTILMRRAHSYPMSTYQLQTKNGREYVEGIHLLVRHLLCDVSSSARQCLWLVHTARRCAVGFANDRVVLFSG